MCGVKKVVKKIFGGGGGGGKTTVIQQIPAPAPAVAAPEVDDTKTVDMASDLETTTKRKGKNNLRIKRRNTKGFSALSI